MGGSKIDPVLLSKIETEKEPRWQTDIKELDRVLGGGVVIGSMVLIGRPGNRQVHAFVADVF